MKKKHVDEEFMIANILNPGGFVKFAGQSEV
jgi:hypothetical protein